MLIDAAQEFVVSLLGDGRYGALAFDQKADAALGVLAGAYAHRVRERDRRMRIRILAMDATDGEKSGGLASTQYLEPGPAEIAQACDIVIQVLRATNLLSKLQRHVLIAVVIEEVSIHEIAESLSVSGQIVSRRLVDAKKRLVHILSQSDFSLDTVADMLSDYDRCRQTNIRRRKRSKSN